MTNTTDDTPELQALYRTYLTELPKKIEQLAEIWQTLQTASVWDNQSFKMLHLLTHRLVGSSATYGFITLSRTLRTLEVCLKNLVNTSGPPTQPQQAQVESLIRGLKAVQLEIDADENEEPPYYASLVEVPHSRSENKLIFLAESDTVQAQELALQIGHFGYVVQKFTQLNAIDAALKEVLPAAIITDVSFPEGQLAGIEKIIQLQSGQTLAIPAIFISAYSDLNTRLEVVRAGGKAYFTKPVNISNLIDKLDSLTKNKVPEPYRILIVEDDLALAEHYAATLRQAHMDTVVVSDPLQIMQPLIDFVPDLILMDVYMPNCSGLELAAVIRQQEAYVSTPIVFLSGETNLDKQMAAMRLGGDDFLTKPIKSVHLISSVAARAQRSRILRAFMVSDGLTGLLNHTTTKVQLDLEVARAKRSNVPMTFAMIDLDHFKSINDTYGHSVGDQVLKNVARLLQQRLRKGDIIGRYGGEEFAIILPNTTGNEAVNVLDEVRINFSQILHRAENIEFVSTFSCGVATVPSFESALAVNEAADKALYEAKRGGRNRVVLL